jgi:enamine deaminase RidA (YjgF/YER057c/UK114 family)
MDMRTFLVAAASLTVFATSHGVAAPEISRFGAAAAPISTVVVAKDVGGVDIAWASGVPGAVKAGDTKAQTIDSLTKLIANLKAQGFGPGDTVMMRVFLVADPAMGKMDFPGMMAAFTQFFGTADQPNKPSRTTVQVAALGQPGCFVEIEAQAIKPHM